MPEPWTYERARSFFDYEAETLEWASRCDLCGGGVREPVADRDRYGFPVRTVRCHSCGLVFQRNPLKPEGLRRLYSGHYRALVSAWHGREINAQTLEPEQREYGRKLARSLTLGDPAAHLPLSARRLLDLGGSTGVVAEVVAADLFDEAKGWAAEADKQGLDTEEPERGPVTIVEPCIAETAAASRRADRVVAQSAEDFDPGEERWDLILLCQTVDHLRSISAVLAKVRTWLAPGGRFFVDAVDSSLIPEPVRYKVDHIYSLTPATMRAYLERAGFTAREVPAPSGNHVAFLCEVA